MSRLLQTRLFALLSEPSQVTNQEMKTAYGCFAEHMKAVSQSENSCSEIFRMLNITCIELVFMESLYRYEQGGKCA